MERFRTELTQRQRSFTGLPVDESAASNPGRTQESRATRKRSLILATIAAGLALLPLSYYGLVGAQAGSTNSGSVQQTLDHVMFWFADPADADACFAPATAGIGSFDADAVSRPAAMSSKSALPGSPLP